MQLQTSLRSVYLQSCAHRFHCTFSNFTFSKISTNFQTYEASFRGHSQTTSKHRSTQNKTYEMADQKDPEILNDDDDFDIPSPLSPTSNLNRPRSESPKTLTPRNPNWREILRAFDHDKDGFMSWNEFENMCSQKGIDDAAKYWRQFDGDPDNPRLQIRIDDIARHSPIVNTFSIISISISFLSFLLIRPSSMSFLRPLLSNNNHYEPRDQKVNDFNLLTMTLSQ